ncbi:VanW family protein [Patescibacteria group bacterium]|nr:VanW family protein [Patescibacteria group bacterium]
MEKKFFDKQSIVAKKWLWIPVAIFIILVGGTFGAYAYVENSYQGKILKGISVAGVDIGGITVDEARAKLDKRIDFVNSRGFVYKANNKEVTIYPNIAAIDGADSLAWLVSWDVEKTLLEVTSFQNDKSFGNFFNKLATLTKGRDFPIYYKWDKEQNQQILENSFKELLLEKKEASYFFEEDGSLGITQESIGQTFDYQLALAETKDQIQQLMSSQIDLLVIADKPAISKEVLERYKDKVASTSKRGDFYLTYEERDWNIPNDIWRQWLRLKQGANDFYVGLDNNLFAEYIKEVGMKDEIEIPVQDAKFKLVDGKVAEFVSSQDGLTINLEDTLKSMEGTLNNPGELEVPFVVEVAESKVDNQDVNDLGIVEIIGIGESDFSGSPVNRIHNIRVGADTLNGMLIKPDEEFSLITALGEIDGEHGYRQELVIKGNQTIPEYGGGLCQIGTTVFRAALGTGLPITERRNHSYRVSYYEPAGTDATIYSPWPDFKFKNDTGKHILIQTRIEGTKLYFDFWGTEDGRVAIATEPEIYNIVAPPEKKIIKTTDLEPGQTKCTERAHYGADAKFNYSVQYPEQPEPVETTFYSHYIPWQEVCLLGVTEEELLAEQQENQTATSTPAE